MRILIVDDQEEIINFIKSGLESVRFFVDTALDGGQGLALALANNYSLIILDNGLPTKTGREITQELRRNNINTPIIMLSVQSESMTKTELLNMGADDYVAKPFSFDELLARIRALLRRPPIIEKDILTINNLHLDTKKQLVKRGRAEIYLTKKEFTLLEYFMRNPEITLSRSMILEHAWDINADPFSNTIESHILSLRKKIDQGNKKKLIITVPGRGYKLSA